MKVYKEMSSENMSMDSRIYCKYSLLNFMKRKSVSIPC